MYKVMVVVKGALCSYYLPVTQQEKRADADRDKAALEEANSGYKFAVVDE